MADEKATITLDGNISPLRQKFREAARDLKNFGDEGKASIERLGGVLGGLLPKFAALASVVSIGGITALAKQAIDAADGLNDLSQQLGIGVPQLAGYKLAVESSGLTMESFGNSVKRLSVYMTQHSDRLAQVGVTSKNVDDALVQLADQFSRMPDGAQKTAVAIALMGRSGGEMIPLLNGGGEALRNLLERGRELYPVTEEMAKSADEFNDRMAEIKVGIQGIVIQIGNWLLPYLDRAIRLWRDNAKEIGNMNAALVGLGALGPVGQTIAILWANVVYVFKQVGAEIGGIAAQLAALLRGDFKQAGIIGDMMRRDAAVARQEIDDLEKRIMGFGNKLSALPIKEKPQDGTNTGANWSAILNPGNGKTAGPIDVFENGSFVTLSKEVAEFIRRQFADVNAMQADMVRDSELAAKKEVEIRKAASEQMRQIDLLRIEGALDAEMDRIDSAEAAARHELEMGNITNAEYLAQLEQFNQQRLAAEMRFVEAKKQLALEDPDKNVVALEQLEIQKAEIHRRYAEQALEVQRQQALESQSIWQQLGDAMSSLWDKAVNAMMNGTLTWRNALHAIFAEIASIFGNMVRNKVSAWIGGKAKELAVSLGFMKVEEAAQTASSAKTITTKAGEAASVAGSNAIKAGSGAAAAVADIPVIGPALALAAMASVFAAVMALGGKVKSASRGYDIPKGLNPMTQLHEEEMVLPAKFANVIRNMAANTGNGGGEGGGTRIVNVLDKDLAEEYLQSPAGERVILNHIRANPGAIKQMLY